MSAELPSLSEEPSTSNPSETQEGDSKKDLHFSRYRSLIVTESILKITTNENYLKRLQNLRKELNYINDTDWMKAEATSERNMITILKNLWISREDRKIELAKKLEEAQSKLDLEIDKENFDHNAQPTSCMKNVLQNSVARNNLRDGNSNEETNCFNRTGIITALKSNHGTIDHGIFFEMDVALSVASALKVGSRVEYLAYKHADTDHIKVVKVYQVVDEYWDEEAPTEQKIEAKIGELKKEQPKFFNTHQRNILGLIVERKPDSITVDTDYKTMNIHLDTVEVDFVPKEGDRVYVCCKVQSDEKFLDMNGEILEEISVHPARLMKNERCTVKGINGDWGVLNEDIYFTFDVLPTACKLNVGDVVNADLIECERGKFIWRCFKLSAVEKLNDSSLNVSNQHRSEANANSRAITIDPDINCVLSCLKQVKTVEFACSNNCDRSFSAHIELPRKSKSQIISTDPEPGLHFELKPREKRFIRFTIEAKHLGPNNEQFVIQFENFRIKRSICIIVCESEAEAKAINQTIACDESTDRDAGGTPMARNRKANYRLRHYAHQVWSNRAEVVPGVSSCPKRRFLANRIGAYEVPERLRKVYLTGESKQGTADAIEEMFPSVKQELMFSNYVSRFQTLIYLEEIECFINFRNYDRERAHFTREGEYLSLTIENLSERRPSLVLGDVVRVVNPWSESESDQRSFDGCIHKVLFNRVLIKFNPAFQQKYNGEDYRLEFYFSRFSYRKQHCAVERVVRHLGEKFLFPSNIQLRSKPQLDVELNEDSDMVLKQTKLEWYNKSLNSVQKMAVYNILRGEVENMPYIIFGPPGTGKTITLVETILQLVKRVPNSRLLVGTPSNSAADLITTRLIESGDLCAGDFIRLVSQNQIEKELIPEHLMPYCATVDIAADGTCSDSMIVTESGLKLKCQMKFLGRHRVTISTCSTLGNFLQMNFPKGHFTHVLIDESGQCTEPDVIIPITQVSKYRGQVILAGDPQQLQAIVTNLYAANSGLSLSLLERILNRSPYLKDLIRYPKSCGFDPRLVTKLLYSYRSLPSILHIYNNLFYDMELIPVLNENSRESKKIQEIRDLLPDSDLRASTHGVFFYGMLSENMQQNDSPSWYNPHEAKNVFLMTLQLYRKNIKPENIAIITPYSKQVKHLRALFTTADIAMPKIGSVEEFQGQERDIVLISTVRSTQHYVASDLKHSLGFVHCAKRINVAISRARYLLYIFGNPHLLVLDPSWRAIIKYCVDNDSYLGCDLPASM